MNKDSWYTLDTTDAVISPSLLVFPKRIAHNIETMVHMAGGPENLRPHIKTHKNAEIITMQMEQGITKFKCATIAEAELLANCNAPDILLAMQAVGANQNRYVQLVTTYPNLRFSTLVDNDVTATELGNIAEQNNITISLYIDLNVGMNRTGIVPSNEALELYKYISEHKFLKIEGLHAYDGHLRNTDVTVRQSDCDAVFKTVLQLKDAILKAGLPEPIPVSYTHLTLPTIQL